MGEPELQPRRRLIEAALVLLAVGLPIGLSLTALAPFLGALLWAVVLAVSGWPLARRLRPLLGGSQMAAAGAVALFHALLLAVPLLYLSVTLTEALDEGYAALVGAVQNGLPPPPAIVERIPLVGRKLAAYWQQEAGDLSGALARSESTLLLAAGAIVRGLGDLVSALGALGFGIFLAFQLLAAGPRVAAMLERVAQALGGPAGGEMLVVSTRAINVVAQGVIGGAVLEAIACGLTFAACGLPAAALLALACFVLRLLQVGTMPVWLAGGAWLWWHGDWARLVLLGLACILVGWLGALLDRRWIGRRAIAPKPLLFLAVLGGLLAWGFTGMFIGAAAVSIAWTMMLRWLAADAAAPASATADKEASP